MQVIGVSEFQIPYILLPAIWVSGIQKRLYSIASYTGVWISDTLYCIGSYIYGCLNFKHPKILLRAIYGCLNFRHPYILLPAIWVSELQTPLYFIASYMGVWISDTHITISCMIGYSISSDRGVWNPKYSGVYEICNQKSAKYCNFC